MSKRMLIDAAHSEEVRVVVLENDRVEDFEVETTGKEQVKGNIYVGKIVRVEPSLQAAFVEYGGNRNGFLAFAEIHPRWFSLPQTEKDDLIEELQLLADRRRRQDEIMEAEELAAAPNVAAELPSPLAEITEEADEEPLDVSGNIHEPTTPAQEDEEDSQAIARATAMADQQPTAGGFLSFITTDIFGRRPRRHAATPHENTPSLSEDQPLAEDLTITTPQGQRRLPSQPIHRRYAIQDVLKEGQKILVQVNKEERGNKGAALSTYISMPGRFTVLMPNTPYAGGISRKITDYADRKELKRITDTITLPKGMGLIVRTAGVGQEAEPIQHDAENMLSIWHKIEEDFEKTPPNTCVHEDGSLLTRAIRDLYADDISEVIVSGSRAYKHIRDYFKSLLPEHVKALKEHRGQAPLFTTYNVEQELNKLFRTRVELPSGGYLIINPTEALVAVDVNSGRSTQERNIEETAFKTNLEAADEIARQLRLRDLAGLVVVDFIDMENRRNERTVEKAMRKATRKDRARIQLNPISSLGLMEISRQRLRPSLRESTFVACPHCDGAGMMPSLSSSALMVLRGLEEALTGTEDQAIVTTSAALAVHVLNHKRELVREMEERYSCKILLQGDDKHEGADHKIELYRAEPDGLKKLNTVEVSFKETAEPHDAYRGRKKRPAKPANGRSDDRQPDRRETPRPQQTQPVKPSTASTTTDEATDNAPSAARRPEGADVATDEGQRQGRGRRRPFGRGRNGRGRLEGDAEQSVATAPLPATDHAQEGTPSAEGNHQEAAAIPESEDRPRRGRNRFRRHGRDRVAHEERSELGSGTTPSADADTASAEERPARRRDTQASADTSSAQPAAAPNTAGTDAERGSAEAPVNGRPPRRELPDRGRRPVRRESREGAAASTADRAERPAPSSDAGRSPATAPVSAADVASFVVPRRPEKTDSTPATKAAPSAQPAAAQAAKPKAPASGGVVVAKVGADGQAQVEGVSGSKGGKGGQRWWK